jgi:hypothetical protein
MRNKDPGHKGDRICLVLIFCVTENIAIAVLPCPGSKACKTPSERAKK